MQVTLSLAWELDFWGKFRRATEAARANLLSEEWAQRQIISSLVSDVASAYFQLREHDLELEIHRVGEADARLSGKRSFDAVLALRAVDAHAALGSRDLLTQRAAGAVRLLVSCPRHSWRKSRSAAPGWQGARSAQIGDV